MKRGLLFLVVILLLAILSGCEIAPGVSPLEIPLPPDGGGTGGVDVPTLPSFLEMLAGPAGWAMLGALFSAMLAKVAWYNTLSADLKRGVIIGASVLAAVAARLLLTYMPASFWAATATYWYIVGGIVMTWLGSQGWYRAVVKPAELVRKVKADLAETGL